MKDNIDYIGANTAFVMAVVNGVVAIFTGSILFGFIAVVFALIGWLLALR